MSEYSIKMAAKLSGLTELSIRAWEGRYSAVTPNRTKSNRRVYKDSDIEKLILLKKLTQHGHRISDLANLPSGKLSELLLNIEMMNNNLNRGNAGIENRPEEIIVNDCIDAIRKYDDSQLMNLLNAATLKYNQPQLIENILIPLMEKTGVYWREGLLRISHEHFTSKVIYKFIINLSDGFQIKETAPRIVITTPDAQYHEVGAMIGLSLAASEGWKTTYLGPSLPAEDISSAVNQLKARVLFLSIVYPPDNHSLNNELKRLREMIGRDVFIIVSGNAVHGYKSTLDQIQAYIVDTPSNFFELLRSIRSKINNGNGEANE